MGVGVGVGVGVAVAAWVYKSFLILKYLILMVRISIISGHSKSKHLF